MKNNEFIFIPGKLYVITDWAAQQNLNLAQKFKYIEGLWLDPNVHTMNHEVPRKPGLIIETGEILLCVNCDACSAVFLYNEKKVTLSFNAMVFSSYYKKTIELATPKSIALYRKK